MTAERTRNPPKIPPTIPPIAPEERDELELTGAVVCVDVAGPPELLTETRDGKVVDAELEVVEVEEVELLVGLKEVTGTDVVVDPP